MYYGSTVPRLTAIGLRVCAREAIRGELPYIVPTGGTSALGALGYVNAAFELAEQVEARELPEPEWIFVPLGSGGTVAGLTVGLRLTGLRSRVASVLVTDILPPSPARLSRLANRCLQVLGERIPGARDVRIAPEDFSIIRDQLGPGYGAATPEAEHARQLIEDTEGIHLETTYTAKCLAALLDERLPASAGGPVLFWNTYSSVDPAAHLGKLPAPQDLPRSFRRFFDDADRA
jgi:D-cysteine desulfhydrase